MAAMEFDKFIEPPCNTDEDGNPLSVDPTTCKPDESGSGGDDEPPVVDDRCADPAFAEANPELCKGYAQLVLKPAYALVESGKTVQYKTYLRAAGNEVELTTGLTYQSSITNIAVIHRSNGLATGVTPGISSIGVAWQNLNAHAQIEVVASCSAEATSFFLLVDNSKSSKVGFNSSFSSRLTYAKEAARRFAESVNYSRDKVAVGHFNSGGTLDLALSSSESAVVNAVAAIPSTDNTTNISEGLRLAKEHLDANGSGTTKVIILFSDGESNQGEDPVAYIRPFKDANGVVVVVALRAWGQYFDLLYRIASPGYFLSSYDATAEPNIKTLIDLKSYLCSGDCAPTPGTFPHAQLNYDGFENWDVFQGAVDLVGLGLFDVLPGNGLYVDLAGTVDAEHPSADIVSPGGLRSKTNFSFAAGKTYRLKIDVAGNNVGVESDNESVRVRVIKGDGSTFLDQTITPTSHTQGFVQSTFDFTPASSESARIQIEMVEGQENNVGPLIDDVILENVTDALTMLNDDFDEENPVVIPPSYSYYGCIEAPPGAQSADPAPPTPPVEG